MESRALHTSLIPLYGPVMALQLPALFVCFPHFQDCGQLAQSFLLAGKCKIIGHVQFLSRGSHYSFQWATRPPRNPAPQQMQLFCLAILVSVCFTVCVCVIFGCCTYLCEIVNEFLSDYLDLEDLSALSSCSSAVTD